MSVAELEPLALATAGEMPAPGSWKGALYRDDAPGAALDSQPWARSWGAFMHAITREDDASAREFIGQVMSRPVNAGFSERTPEAGGFLVPEQLRSQVLSYMTPANIRPSAQVVPMSSLSLAIPFLDNPDESGSRQALGGLTFAWTGEGAPITPTSPAFGRERMEARKAAALLKDVPNELAADAAGALGDFFGGAARKGYAWFEDDAFISGSGAGEPQGLIGAPCAVAVDRANADEVGFADIVAMMKALHPASKSRGLVPGITSTCWLLSAAVLDQLMELFYSPAAGEAIAPPGGGFSMGDGYTAGPSLMGLPAFPTDHQPALGTAGDVILADLAEYVIADRMEMTVERSRQGAGFGADASDFRIKARLDGRYWIQSATTTESGQVVSPVVILGTHS